MKSYLDLVPQYEKVHRKQSKMSRICIILAVFLVAVMFGLADMYLQGITQKVMQENGDWHYQITSIDTKTSDLIAARPEVEVSGWHSIISADAGYSISGQPIAISGLDEDVFGEIYLASLAEGKYPNAANEIAVSSVLKESNDLDLGSVIDLTCPDGSTVSFSIVGFFDNPEKARLIVGSEQSVILAQEGFAICIVLFLTFSTLVNFMQNAFMPSEWTPELSIVSETNTCSIDSVLLESIKQNENVKRAYGRMFAYDVPVNIDGSNHKANVISYEANQFKWSADYLTAGSISVVEQEENHVLVVNTENTDVRVGDVITLSINGKEQAVTVAGILSDSPLAREEGTETIFCSEKTFVALTGQTGYTIIDVQFQNGASIEDVKDIENIFTDGGVVFTEQLSQVQQQRNLYSAFAVLVYGFLSIIVAITIFHIMNTINMGVIAKTKQYGTMRAIGMSNQQLIKMIVAEAMTYAVSGIILGCIIGLPMHWVVFASLITNFWGTAWSIPIFPLALIIGIVLFTSFLAVRSPAKRLHDMAIVDTIKSQQ